MITIITAITRYMATAFCFWIIPMRDRREAGCCSVGAFVYVVIHCIQCLVDLIITKIIIDISAGGQPA